jgi:tetratricopeptide (TPR) repeat protein
MERFFAGDPAGARAALDEALATRPGDPLLQLGRLKLDWWSLLEGTGTASESERRVRESLESIEEAAAPRLARRFDPMLAYALGEAHCTAGRLDALRGRSWSAFRHHQTGIGWLSEVQRVCPRAPEPLASLGLFRYYAARLPRSLRVLGRLAGLGGDRVRGLKELRRAASAPGPQAVEAQFFLLQILAAEEGDQPEALLFARRLESEHPRIVAFAMLHAQVLADLERPDEAVRALAAVPESGPAGGLPVRGRATFFAARLLAESGRPQRALFLLDSLAAVAPGAVAGIEPWAEVVRGSCYLQLGRPSEARAALERALASADAAGAHDRARRIAERRHDPSAPARSVAESLLVWADDAPAARCRLDRVREERPGDDPDGEFWELQSRACLRSGDARAALEACDRALRAEPALEPPVVGRLRARRLQALLWCGEGEAARRAAAAEAEPHAHFEMDRLHELLVAEILAPTAPLSPDWREPAAHGADFRLRDLGSSRVDLVLRIPGRERRIPMAYRRGWWEATVALAAGPHLYAFELEGRAALLDPEASELVLDAGSAWTVRRVAGPSS